LSTYAAARRNSGFAGGCACAATAADAIARTTLITATRCRAVMIETS
jgi:hypothetical protein